MKKEEASQAGVEHSADAARQFCRHCGAAMESGSTVCGECGMHKIHPDRLTISLSRLIDEAMASRFCTQCGARVTEGKQFCHTCGQQIGKLHTETPSANTASAPVLTPPEVTKAQTQPNSDGYDGLRGLPQLAAEGYATATYPTTASPRRALWRRPITLTGAAILVVVAAAVITSFRINNPQGSFVPSVTRDARQSASLTTGEVERNLLFFLRLRMQTLLQSSRVRH